MSHRGRGPCSEEEIEHLMAEMEGYQGEMLGHERNGHVRAHLGKSFGRPEGEIREDIERVQQQLIQCNLE